jgi:hypothetical protein
MSRFAPVSCDTFPLIFNGSKIMSEAPRDMERDMTVRWDSTTDAYDVFLANLHLPPDVLDEYWSSMSAIAGPIEPEPPPRPLAPVAQPEIVDPETLIDKAIAMVGFEEVERLIKARKPKKKRGRHDYTKLDNLLIKFALSLREEWKRRLGRPPGDKGLPTRHALATKIVDLCWDDYDVLKPWGFKCLRDFGTDSKKTVVTRLLGRDASWWNAVLMSDDEQDKRRADRWGGWDRRRPDVNLLPGKSFRKFSR